MGLESGHQAESLDGPPLPLPPSHVLPAPPTCGAETFLPKGCRCPEIDALRRVKHSEFI